MKAIIKTIIGTIIAAIILAIIMPIIGPTLSSLGGQPVIPQGKTVIEKNTSPNACNCSETTCSICLTRRRASNDPVNPDPSVLSPHEQPVQTNSGSRHMIHKAKPSPREQSVQINSENDHIIRQRAKKHKKEWYDDFSKEQKAKLSPHEQSVQINPESDSIIRQRAKKHKKEWYDDFSKEQKANR